MHTGRIARTRDGEGKVTERRTLIYDRRENVGFISLNRPEKLNAENALMARELLDALKEAEADPDVRVVVFRGEGRAFCSGHDLSEATSGESLETDMADVELLQKVTEAIMGLGKPIIAAVHGYVLGAGCEWAMNCDMIIAAEGTKFGFPETRLGTAVGSGGTKLLPLLIGLLRAKEMILSNRIIDAELAEKWGLANRVVPLNALLEDATRTAAKMAENSALANRIAKLAINGAICIDFQQTLQMELKDMVLTSSTTNWSTDKEKPG